jgi:hypothetical protein
MDCLGLELIPTGKGNFEQPLQYFLAGLFGGSPKALNTREW